MKTYKFEITLDENQLAGDEFWEEITRKDSTGVSGMTDAMKDAIQDHFFGYPSDDIEDIVVLKEYTDK